MYIISFSLCFAAAPLSVHALSFSSFLFLFTFFMVSHLEHWALFMTTYPPLLGSYKLNSRLE
jgi:hypothetical protein